MAIIVKKHNLLLGIAQFPAIPKDKIVKIHTSETVATLKDDSEKTIINKNRCIGDCYE